jgi:hypothetical protein
MTRKIFFSVLLILSVIAIVYGDFFRKFQIFENIEKFEQLKKIGIKIKLPGYEQSPSKGEPKLKSERFTEPEVVQAMTFAGIGRHKDGRLVAKIADLRMLKGHQPCPS